MAGNSSTPAATKKAAAAPPKDSPVGVKDDPLANAHPLVGVAGVAEQVVAGPRTAEEQRRAIADEYGEFVATAAITHDGALAYNVDDAVPAANVEAWGYLALGLVARRTTKRAAAVTDRSDDPDPTDPNAPLA